MCHSIQPIDSVALGVPIGTMSSGRDLHPIKRATLAQQVMQRLIEYVHDAELQAGDVLPSQHELARQLAVSRPVLREAMQGLASIGFLEIRPGSGCYVGRTPPVTHASDLFEIATHDAALQAWEARMVVEVELAGMAAIRATEADIQDIEAALRRINQAVLNGDETSDLTLRFHQILAASGHNSYLLRMSELLDQARVAQFMRVQSSLPDVKARQFESHRILIEAICSRDPDIAREAMREHLRVAHGHEERVSELRSEQRCVASQSPIDSCEKSG